LDDRHHPLFCAGRLRRLVAVDRTAVIYNDNAASNQTWEVANVLGGNWDQGYGRWRRVYWGYLGTAAGTSTPLLTLEPMQLPIEWWVCGG
jgi:hypothetical protein